jgi:hypothetical protein
MDTISDEGWVKLHRKIIDNPIFKDAKTLQLFIYLLLKASHKSQRFIFNGKEMILERGQLITGRKRIRKDTKLTDREIRTRIKLLGNVGILTSKTTNRYSVITICNYCHYQDSTFIERPTKRPADDQQTTTYKNVKNIKKTGSSPKKAGDPRVKGFLDYWKGTFSQQTGMPYVFSYGKEGNLANTLLQSHDLPILQDAVRAFFRDEQCKRRGLTIGIFFQEINRLLGARVIDPLEQARREMRERQAVREIQGNHAGSETTGDEMGDSAEKRTPKSSGRNPIKEAESILAGGTD